MGKDGFLLTLSIVEVTLVGGSGPYEGHIFVNGLPVCDDGHNDQNALVVCRFVKTLSFLTQVDHSFDLEFLKNCLGCLDTLLEELQCNLGSAQLRILLGWTTSNVSATKPRSLIVRMSLWMIVVHLKGLGSSAQIWVRFSFF